MKQHNYWVYIMTNKYNKVLYVGVTNDIARRVSEHKNGICKGFSWKYNCHKLVYYEHFQLIDAAIAFEEKVKCRRRSYKIDLITCKNPDWQDLYEQVCD